jgi:hypothetical protein
MGEDFMQILGVLLEELKKEEVELAATMTKKIWLHLNTKHFFFFGGEFTHHSRLNPNGVIKANCDAIINKSRKMMGCGGYYAKPIET